MQEARCEIVVLSKLGGVQDLKVLADGVESFGRIYKTEDPDAV